MLKAFLSVARLFVTVAFFELAGAALVVAGVCVVADEGWGLIAAGVLALLKAFDLESAKGR